MWGKERLGAGQDAVWRRDADVEVHILRGTLKLSHQLPRGLFFEQLLQLPANTGSGANVRAGEGVFCKRKKQGERSPSQREAERLSCTAFTVNAILGFLSLPQR